jgi:outer membrane protein OmpA-like peptidoglycan-associated protein
LARRTVTPQAPGGHVVTFGFTDLMTSLAVIFVLLMVVFANAARPPEHHPQPVPVEPPAVQLPVQPSIAAAAEPPIDVPAAVGLSPAERVQDVLLDSSADGVALEVDSHDPQVLRVIIPDTVLNFQSGSSELAPAADRFLAEMAPSYAALLCGELRDLVTAVVIEGHTDDLGGDALNLRLSQERSLRVLVRGLEAIHDAMPAHYDCFSRLASASGRGKQDLVYDESQQPDRELSRRVVLKILLRSSAPRA